MPQSWATRHSLSAALVQAARHHLALVLLRGMRLRLRRSNDLNDGIGGGVDAEELGNPNGRFLDRVLQHRHLVVRVARLLGLFEVLVLRVIAVLEVAIAGHKALNGARCEVQVADGLAAGALIATGVAGRRKTPPGGLQESDCGTAQFRARCALHRKAHRLPKALDRLRRRRQHLLHRLSSHNGALGGVKHLARLAHDLLRTKRQPLFRRIAESPRPHAEADERKQGDPSLRNDRHSNAERQRSELHGAPRKLS
mmetsp:Transcript_32018/g.92268  ORF Transcript_32018/g.92268 Transcript_32018/m.92268 type:complete len:254 (+) Transcript_32018:192-953(+)